MIVRVADKSDMFLSKTQWLFQYYSFDFAEVIDFLQQRKVNLVIDFPIKALQTTLRNWWEEVSVSASKEVLVTLFFIPQNSPAMNSLRFLITGEDAIDFIEIIKKRWKSNLEKLTSIDLPKSEPVKTKTEPPPEIKLPKNDSPYPYRE